jgi:hypothetical protein
MEDFLRTIANNVQRGNNQGGGNGVNQYSNFKDFMDTRPPIFKEATIGIVEKGVYPDK